MVNYVRNPRDCTAVDGVRCTVEGTLLGYLPNMAGNTIFTVIFLICAIINAFLGIKYKTWTYMVALTGGCALEALGYAGRIMMNKDPFGDMGFQLQISLLIIAPAVLSAGIYLTLKHFVINFGESWSRLRPAWYTYIFVVSDLISLVLQGMGGGMAATGDPGSTKEDLGTKLMIAGVIFQVVTLSIFGVLASEYIYNTYQRRHQLSPTAMSLLSQRNFKAFVGAVMTGYILIFIRCIYRIPELTGGWGNDLMRNEADFMILEGAAISIAAMVLTALHPGYCFPQLAKINRLPASGKTFNDAGSMSSV